MNPKKERIIEELKSQGYTLLDHSNKDPEAKRYMLFSRDDQRYLISFHNKNTYSPNQGSFYRALIDTKIINLNPLPIFDEEVFFRPDKGRSRENDDDRRDLFGLELITLEMFKIVTYATHSGLFVVTYGPAYADYSNAIVKGVIPREQMNRKLKGTKTVKQRQNYPHFELTSSGGLGLLQVPEEKIEFDTESMFDIIPRDPRNDQLREISLDTDDTSFTWEEHLRIQESMVRDRTEII